MSRRPCEVGIRGCAGLLFPDFHQRKYKAEPRTGIEFPMVLDNLDGEPVLNSASEVSTFRFSGPFFLLIVHIYKCEL